jgi:type II secretory pathway predicted ATPase ExeA
VLGRKGQEEPVQPPMHPEELEQRRAAHQRGTLALEAAFRETADPHSYVARDATEEVLAQLLSSVMASRGPVVFNAKPGLGKTILLHVLAERLVGHARCVFLPYGALSLDDLCAWSLGRMGEARGRKPVQALLSIARQLAEDGQVLTLLIDDACGLPLESARQLRALWKVAKGGLQLVLTLPDDAKGDRVFAALGPECSRVRLASPMSVEETGDFVRGRLAHAGVPKVSQNRFDRACATWIHSQSGGVPRLAQRLGETILVDQPDDVCTSSQPDHEWLGTPLDDL